MLCVLVLCGCLCCVCVIVCVMCVVCAVKLVEVILDQLVQIQNFSVPISGAFFVAVWHRESQVLLLKFRILSVKT